MDISYHFSDVQEVLRCLWQCTVWISKTSVDSWSYSAIKSPTSQCTWRSLLIYIFNVPASISVAQQAPRRINSVSPWQYQYYVYGCIRCASPYTRTYNPLRPTVHPIASWRHEHQVSMRCWGLRPLPAWCIFGVRSYLQSAFSSLTWHPPQHVSNGDLFHGSWTERSSYSPRWKQCRANTGWSSTVDINCFNTRVEVPFSVRHSSWYI